MKITHDNYYSQEANQYYFTASQIKSYMGCPSRWLAERSGLYKREETDALFHGKYVDTALTTPEDFDQFCQDNADKIFGRGNKKKKAILDIDAAIARVKRDEFWMSFLSGKGQVIIVIKDFHGHPYKCMLDDLNIEAGTLTDLKSARSVTGEEWTTLADGGFAKLHWIAHWRYPLQLALYREAVYLSEGWRPHPYIVAMEKKEIPNFEVFDLFASERDKLPLRGEVQRGVEAMDNMAEIAQSDPMEVKRCGRCEWCLKTKVITKPVAFEYDPRMLQF